MLRQKTVTVIPKLPKENAKTLCTYISQETGKHLDYEYLFGNANIFTKESEDDRNYLQKKIFNDDRLIRRIARGNMKTGELKEHLKGDVNLYRGNMTFLNRQIADFFRVPLYPAPVYVPTEFT